MRQEKEIKCVQIRMEEMKLSLFADDITVCVGNLKCTPQSRETLIQKLVIFASFYAHSTQISQFADNVSIENMNF